MGLTSSQWEGAIEVETLYINGDITLDSSVLVSRIVVSQGSLTMGDDCEIVADNLEFKGGVSGQVQSRVVRKVTTMSPDKLDEETRFWPKNLN
jgi:hypothetical protein